MDKITMDLEDVLELIEKAIIQKQYDQALEVLRDLRKQVTEYSRPIPGSNHG